MRAQCVCVRVCACQRDRETEGVQVCVCTRIDSDDLCSANGSTRRFVYRKYPLPDPEYRVKFFCRVTETTLQPVRPIRAFPADLVPVPRLRDASEPCCSASGA